MWSKRCTPLGEPTLKKEEMCSFHLFTKKVHSKIICYLVNKGKHTGLTFSRIAIEGKYKL